MQHRRRRDGCPTVARVGRNLRRWRVSSRKISTARGGRARLHRSDRRWPITCLKRTENMLPLDLHKTADWQRRGRARGRGLVGRRQFDQHPPVLALRPEFVSWNSGFELHW